MSLGPILLVLASALFWVGFDVVRKQLVAHVDAVALAFWLTLGQLPGFLLWAWVEGGAVGAGYWAPALASVVLNVAATGLFFEAVRVSPLSVTIPLLALTPCFAALLGVPVLGEHPSGVQLLGIALVVTGALVLPAQAEDGWHPGRMLRSLVAERGAIYMIAVALLWALAGPLDKLALRSAAVGIHGAVLTGGVSGGLLVFLALRRQLGALRGIRRVPGRYAVGLALGIGALGIQLLAFQVVFVSVVEAVKRAVGVGAAVLSGRWFFGEPITASKVIATTAMAGGVGLLLLT